MNCPSPALGRTIMTALYLVGTATGAVAQDRTPVHYTCADGTKLQATFSPPSTSMGSVKLVYAGSSTEMTLPQALSADGGRYTAGRHRVLDQREGCNADPSGKVDNLPDQRLNHTFRHVGPTPA